MAHSKIVHCYAFDVAEAFIRQSENSNPHLNNYHAEAVDARFRKLAEALGYEVAKIVTPADEAA